MSAESAAVWCCSKCGAVYHKDFPRCPNDGAEVVLSLRDPLLDQRIGQYVIDRLIGEGGMGRVYAAHHATLAAKRYAIKVLLGDVAATSSMRRRFAMEAESASRLDHPNVVHVIDFGEMPSGLPYIVMDFVDGVALTDLIDTPMEPARVIRLARAVCDGLSYAHDGGVVHRDLKPDNIMVVIANDGSELPRIADFGLATTFDSAAKESRLTTTGMAMGTPAYAAPEQMAGKRVDHKADLYALGMTMFEMLTGGTLPFEGHPMEMMTAKAHREAPRVTEVSPELKLPDGLEDLIALLVKRRSVERPGSAREVLAALDRIVLGSAVDERAATVANIPLDSDTEPRRPVFKTEGVRRTRAWPLLAGLVAIAGAGTGGYLYTHRAPAAPAPVAAAAVTAPPPAPVAKAPVANAESPIQIAVLEHEPLRANQDLEPELDAVAAPKQATSRPHTRSAPRHKIDKVAPKQAVKEPKPIVESIAAVPPVPPAPDPVPAPLPPVTIVTEIERVDVQGALSQASVRRAVERVLPALRGCAPATPQAVLVHFTIDESRRAQHLRGGPACVVAALGGVRTDTAPDVGDAEVDVKINFVAKP